MLDSKSKKWKPQANKASMIAATLDFEMPILSKADLKSLELAQANSAALGRDETEIEIQ